MTLDSYINKNPNNKYYIGAQSSFIFIGNAEQYQAEINGISDKYAEHRRKAYVTARNNLKAAEKMKDQSKLYKELYKTAEASYKTVKEVYEWGKKHKDIRKRKVRETYGRYDDPTAIIILIEGSEMGRYWLESEVNRNEDKEKAVCEGSADDN